LRYGDGVQKSSIPVIAGAAAAIVAAPIVAILPIVGAPAALALGAGVGLGTRACVHDIDGKLTPDPARPAGPAAFARARARPAPGSVCAPTRNDLPDIPTLYPVRSP
jgi:hypothetical protein